MERNNESDNDLSQAETLFEFAYKHVNSQYRRGRFLGCLIEDCKHTPGAKVPQPIGKRGQEYIYRVEDLAAAYRAVSRHYQRTKLCAPRHVQRPDGLYCNIPALVSLLELDHHTVKDIVRKHKVRFCKSPGSRTLWHAQDAIAVVNQMRSTLFDFSHERNLPFCSNDREHVLLSQTHTALTEAAEEVEALQFALILLGAIHGFQEASKIENLEPTEREGFEASGKVCRKYFLEALKGASMQILYPAGGKE